MQCQSAYKLSRREIVRNEGTMPSDQFAAPGIDSLRALGIACIMRLHETRLEMAQRYVFRGRQIVEQQKSLIERKKASGLDTDQAEGLLRAFERTLVTFEDDLTAIVAEIKL